MGKEAAKILLDTQSVLFNAREPFTYTSGKKGPVYVDCRRLISFPEERSRLMDMGAEIIRKQCPAIDYIAGGETAGIPYAAFLAERLNLPMLYVRKKPKGFARMAQIEGCLEKDNARVLLVEDVQNFGVSVKTFIDALRGAGTTVKDIFVIFSHGHESSRRNMQDMGVALHALCAWRDVLEVVKQGNLLDAPTLESVEAFLHNPEEWAA